MADDASAIYLNAITLGSGTNLGPQIPSNSGGYVTSGSLTIGCAPGLSALKVSDPSLTLAVLALSIAIIASALIRRLPPLKRGMKMPTITISTDKLKSAFAWWKASFRMHDETAISFLTVIGTLVCGLLLFVMFVLPIILFLLTPVLWLSAVFWRLPGI